MFDTVIASRASCCYSCCCCVLLLFRARWNKLKLEEPISARKTILFTPRPQSTHPQKSKFTRNTRNFESLVLTTFIHSFIECDHRDDDGTAIGLGRHRFSLQNIFPRENKGSETWTREKKKCNNLVFAALQKWKSYYKLCECTVFRVFSLYASLPRETLNSLLVYSKLCISTVYEPLSGANWANRYY